MTVSVANWKAGPYVGNGVATSFTFNFKCLNKNDVRVVRTVIATNIETDLVLDSDYSVALNADQEVAPGGTVTYPVSGTALPSTQKLTIVSDMAITQATDITNGGGFYPQVIENALDKLTILVAQNAEALSRAAIVGVSSTDNPSELLNSLINSVNTAVSAASSASSSATAAAVSESNAADSEAYVASVANDIQGYVDTSVQTALSNIATPPQFDNDTSIATTAFVQRAIGGFGRIFSYGTAGNTIPADRVNSHINLFGACSSITLPLANSVPAGSVLMFDGISLTCTINRQGTNYIYLNSNNNIATSFVVNDGSSVMLISDGAGSWYATGIATLKYAADFGSSLATNGYQKLPSGLILQWGAATISANSTSTITLPVSYPNACLNVLASLNQQDTTTASGYISGYIVSSSQIRISNSIASAKSVFWQTLGN